MPKERTSPFVDLQLNAYGWLRYIFFSKQLVMLDILEALEEPTVEFMTAFEIFLALGEYIPESGGLPTNFFQYLNELCTASPPLIEKLSPDTYRITDLGRHTLTLRDTFVS